MKPQLPCSFELPVSVNPRTAATSQWSRFNLGYWKSSFRSIHWFANPLLSKPPLAVACTVWIPPDFPVAHSLGAASSKVQPALPGPLLSSHSTDLTSLASVLSVFLPPMLSTSGPLRTLPDRQSLPASVYPSLSSVIPWALWFIDPSISVLFHFVSVFVPLVSDVPKLAFPSLTQIYP